MPEPSQSSLTEVPLSAARVAGHIFVSGQVPRDKRGQLAQGDIEEQTKLCLDAVRRELQQLGSSLDEVVKTTVFLSDTTHFAEMNQAYAACFGENKPARSTVGVKLAVDVLVEIEAVALRLER